MQWVEWADISLKLPSIVLSQREDVGRWMSHPSGAFTTKSLANMDTSWLLDQTLGKGIRKGNYLKKIKLFLSDVLHRRRPPFHQDGAHSANQKINLIPYFHSLLLHSQILGQNCQHFWLPFDSPKRY